MKPRNIFQSVLVIIALMLSFTAMADQPKIVVDGKIHVEYDQVIEITEHTTNTVGQFNHGSSQKSLVNVKSNHYLKNVDIDSQAIGNNATIGSQHLIQGNQLGGQKSLVTVAGNKIKGSLEIDSTAVGNNATVEGDAVVLNALQFNLKSPQQSTVNVTGNHFVYDMKGNPTIASSAIGNNLNVNAASVASVKAVQWNRWSPAVSEVNVQCNTGLIGDLKIDSTAVGNNLNLSASDE